MKLNTIIATLVVMAVAPATASATTPTVYGHDFGKQNPYAVVLPLTIKLTASRPDITFSLSTVDQQAHERRLIAVLKPRAEAVGNRWVLHITIRRVPKLDALYDIFANAVVQNGDGPSGYVASFHSFDPQFKRNLTVRSNGNTIMARAEFEIRAPSPSGYHITAAVQRYCNGSWRTLKSAGAKDSLITSTSWDAAVPPIKLRHTVSNLQQLIRRGAQFRVVMQYRFYTGTGYDIVKPFRTVRDVPAQRAK